MKNEDDLKNEEDAISKSVPELILHDPSRPYFGTKQNTDLVSKRASDIGNVKVPLPSIKISMCTGLILLQ